MSGGPASRRAPSRQDAAGVRRRAVAFLLIAGAILWLPFGSALAGRPPGFLRELGFLSGPRGTPTAWAVAIVAGVLYARFAVRHIPLVRAHWRAVSWLKVVALVVAAAAAVVEEAFFRRLVMDLVADEGYGAALQVLASAAAFGVAHAVWALVTGHWLVGLRVVLATGTLGGLLAAAYVLGDRSLAPVIVSHFIVTATIQPGIMLAMFSGQMR